MKMFFFVLRSVCETSHALAFRAYVVCTRLCVVIPHIFMALILLSLFARDVVCVLTVCVVSSHIFMVTNTTIAFRAHAVCALTVCVATRPYFYGDYHLQSKYTNLHHMSSNQSSSSSQSLDISGSNSFCRSSLRFAFSTRIPQRALGVDTFCTYLVRSTCTYGFQAIRRLSPLACRSVGSAVFQTAYRQPRLGKFFTKFSALSRFNRPL